MYSQLYLLQKPLSYLLFDLPLKQEFLIVLTGIHIYIVDFLSSLFLSALEVIIFLS